MTPHLGASTSEAQENVAIQVAQQISDYLNNDVIVNSINVSPISLEDAPKLKPFIDLSFKLVKFGGQIIENTMNVNNLYKSQLCGHTFTKLKMTLFNVIILTGTTILKR